MRSLVSFSKLALSRAPVPPVRVCAGGRGAGDAVVIPTLSLSRTHKLEMSSAKATFPLFLFFPSLSLALFGSIAAGIREEEPRGEGEKRVTHDADGAGRLVDPRPHVAVVGIVVFAPVLVEPAAHLC